MPKKGVSKWNDKKIVNGLKILCDKLGYFPTANEFIEIKEGILLSAIVRYGGINKFRKLLGYDLLQRSKNFWNDNTIIENLKPIIETFGYFPTQKDLLNINRQDLIGTIRKHGGSNKFRTLLGYDLLKKPNGYWTDKTICIDLEHTTEKLGHFPTANELKSFEKQDLVDIINTKGGLPRFRLLMGYDLIVKPIGYWNDDTIQEELTIISEKINHFPTHEEMMSMDRSDLSVAITKNGGIDKFRTLMDYDLIRKPGNYWCDNTIIDNSKKICIQLGHFPTEHELISMDRYDLFRAIQKHGGFPKFQELCGYPLSIHNKYISELASYCCKRGHSSENIIHKILLDYCSLHNLYPPQLNKKLSQGNVIEFVCNTNKTIGIDVTNTKSNYRNISRKWFKKQYHLYLDELWVVVFSNIFTEQDYIKFNKQSPPNVKIFSIYQFLEELNYSLDEFTKSKIDKYCSCTFHTKEELKTKILYLNDSN